MPIIYFFVFLCYIYSGLPGVTMGDFRSDSPLDGNNPNPGTPKVTDDDLDQMGVDKSVRGFVDGVIAIGAGLGILGRWLGRGFLATIKAIGMGIAIIVLGTCLLAVTAWKWIRADRKNALVAGLSVAVLALGFIAFGGNKAPIGISDPPIPAQTAGLGQHKVTSGENWESIAKANRITADELRAANTDIIELNTAWCNARPTSKFYRAGLLEDGKTARNGTFCQLFDGKALETLREKQVLNVPITANSGPALANTVNQNP